MHSIYIGQLLRPAAAPLIMRMRVCLGGVAMVCDYPHPALQTTVFQALMIETKKLNPVSTQISRYNVKTIIGKIHAKTSLSSVVILTTRNNSN